MATLKKIEGHDRTQSAAALRRTGAVPAIVYGHGVASRAIHVDNKTFRKIWQEVGMTSLMTLSINNEEIPVLIREIQMHPLREEVIHVDFYQVRMDETIEANVPLVFTGVAPAVKDLSGVLVKNLDEIELEALPQDLPHEITVDISSLTDFEKAIYVKDLHLPDRVTILTDSEHVVALVQPPRSEQELEQLSEEVKEDVESIEGIKKEEAPVEAEEGVTEKPKEKE